ncbi:hypothetical protein NQ317_005440 [Molorchus minor]|uniref:C2H2-type domain-containing protein n=1 Tax=Molorchus minor TaxID=1323400 RepID=A0ABQ9JJV9_9CUCU|nr:hypothetical protein NQ317_005440 [Molorchus minor]
MQENLCLQCKNVSAGPSNRLVQDSCGHKKCRVCLLEDEEKCKQCEDEKSARGENTNVNGTTSGGSKTVFENGDLKQEIFLNNHTAVIQMNGNASLVSNSGAKDKTPNENSASIADESGNIQNRGATVKGNNGLTLKVSKKRKAQAKGKKCDKEKKRAYSSVDIPKHIKVNLDPLSYHCDICDKNFITKAHVKYHTYCAGAVKPYKCEICQKEFILRAQLDVHSYKHKNVKPHACSVCKKSFADRSKLIRHSTLHSNVNAATPTGARESLRLHSIIHKGEKPYVCKLCPSRFNNLSNLNKHIISHSKEKAHMCDQCGKRFKLKWALSVHRKSHLRIRPHECGICLKTFVNNKDLQRHSLIHADDKGYTCSICRTSFCRKDNLNRHMRNTHPGKKGEVIKNVVKPPELPPKKNPEAVSPVKSDSRSGTVINGPIKLAFKTPAFKSHYNINRDFNYIPPQIQKAYDMAESVDICQKILSPKTAILPRSIIGKADLMSNYPTPPIHYETSFQNRKHAMIKNIKFKVPIQYTNNFKENAQKNNPSEMNDFTADSAKNDISQLSDNRIVQDASNNNTYAELKPVAMTSVIVNNNMSQPSSMHWRRRTSQNLNLKN